MSQGDDERGGTGGAGGAGGENPDTRALRPRSSRRRRIFVVLAAVVFPLVLLEVGARVVLLATGRTMRQIRFDPDSFHFRIYREHPYTVYCLAPGSKRTESGVEYSVNSLGYRGPEFTVEKPAGETRVVCVGGSTTFGTALADQDSYPRRLESRLRTRFPQRNPSVVNAGVPGFTSAETLVNVALRILDLEPDYLVVLDNVNELSPRRWPNFAADYSHFRKPFARPEPSILGGFFESFSAFYCLARFHLTDYRWCQYVEFYCTRDFTKNWMGPPVDLSERTLRPFHDRLVRVCRLARASGARPVLCTMAHRGDFAKDGPVFTELMAQQNEAIREIARTEDVPLADLDAELTGTADHFVDAVHFTPGGAALVASVVGRSLLRDGTWGEPTHPKKTSPTPGGGEPAEKSGDGGSKDR